MNSFSALKLAHLFIARSKPEFYDCLLSPFQKQFRQNYRLILTQVLKLHSEAFREILWWIEVLLKILQCLAVP